MAIYSSSLNSVSAAMECYGGSLDHFFCTYTIGKPPQMFVMECSKDKDGKWDCQTLTKKAIPPAIVESVPNAMR